MTGYPFNAARDADMVQGEHIYEMDFALNQGDNSTNEWTEQEIRVNPVLPFRHLYISFHNTTDQTSDVTGILRCFYSRKVVYQQPMRFYSGTAPSTLTASGGVLLPAFQTTLVMVPNGLVLTRRGTANVISLSPFHLFVTCDQIVFTPTQQVKGATGNQAWFLACKSAAGPMVG